MRGIKNRGNERWKKLGVFLALFIVFGLLLNSVHNVYKKKKSAEEALVRMQKERAELLSRSEELRDDLARLGTKEGLDFEIRKRFNVAGAGEGVAIIVPEEITASSTKPTATFWQKFKNFFSDLIK